MSTIIDGVEKALGFDSIILRYVEEDQILEIHDADFNDDLIQHRRALVIGQTRAEPDEKGAEDVSETELGYVEGYLFRFGGALNAGVDLVDEADAYSSDLYGAADVLAALYEDDEDWRADCYESTGLYVHELFLKPEYRGHRLGEIAIRRFIDRFDPSSLFAIVLCPNARYFFQTGAFVEGEFTLKATKPSDPLSDLQEGPAQKKLEAWYCSLGFSPLETKTETEEEGDKTFWAMHGDAYDIQWRFRTTQTKPVKRKAKAIQKETAKSTA